MASVTICSDFGVPPKKVCHCFHCFPIYLTWSEGTGCMILVFSMLSFKSSFSVSSFTFIKRLFSFPLLSAIRVVPSAYLRLLIFLLEILIPACASSSPVFLMMYSVYKLNKQGDNIQPWHALFPFWNLSVAPWEKNLNKSGYTYIYTSYSLFNKNWIYSIVKLYFTKNKNWIKVNQISGINHNHIYDSFQWALGVLADYGTQEWSWEIPKLVTSIWS